MRRAGRAWVLAALTLGLAGSLLDVPADLGATLLSLARDLLPPGPHLVANAARSVAGLLLAGAILLGADASGVRLLRWLIRRRPAGAARFAAPLLAYAVLSTALLGASAAGLWYPVVLFGVAAAGAAFALPEAAAVLREWRSAAGAVAGSLPPAGKALLSVLAIWWLALLAPPEIEVDCMSYHLAFPQQILVQHRLFGTDIYSHWAIPLIVEFGYVYPVALKLDSAARALALALAVLGAFSFVRSLRTGLTAGGEAGLVLLALVLPASRYVLGTAKNDGPACGYALAAAAVLLESGVLRRSMGRPGTALLAALLAGVAVAAKYVTLPVVLAVALAGFFRVRHRDRGIAFALLAPALLLPVLPWSLKSWLYLADPLYPLGLVALPDLFGDPAKNDFTRKLFDMYVMETRPKVFFLEEMARLAWDNSFVLLAAAPALLRPGCLPGGRGCAGLLLGATLAGFGAIVFGMRGGLDTVERFSMPVFVLWNAAGAAALARYAGAAGERRWFPRAVAGIAGAILVLGHVRLVAPEWFPSATWQKHKRPGAYVAGRLSAGEFRRAGLFAYGEALPEVRSRVAAGDRRGKVLAVGEIKCWDIPARTLMQVFETPLVWRALAGADSVERVRIRFRQLDVRWLLYNQPVAGWERFHYSPYDFSDEMLALYGEFARRHLRIVVRPEKSYPNFGSLWFYEVSDRPRARPPERVLFLPGSERALAYASLAGLNRAHGLAVERFAAARERMPGVVWVESLLGDALLKAGRAREAHPLIRGAAEAGLLDDDVLLNLARAAGKLGKRAEARAALERAAAAYPLWPERVSEARNGAGLGL